MVDPFGGGRWRLEGNFKMIEGSSPCDGGTTEMSVKYVSQITPLASVRNTIIASVSLDNDLAPGSTLTISGLVGTKTLDRTLTIVSTNNTMATSAVWTRKTGTLVLMTQLRMQRNQMVVMNLNLSCIK